MKLSLANQIFLAILAGIGLGALAPGAVGYVSWLGTLFILALKMLIAPLILASIVMGMASLGDVRRLGPLGGKTVAFSGVTTVSAVILGLCLVNLIQPGRSDTLLPEDEAVLASFEGHLKTAKVSDHAAVAALFVETLKQRAQPEGGEAQQADLMRERLRGTFVQRAAQVGLSDAQGAAGIARKLLAAERLRARISAGQDAAAAKRDREKLQNVASVDRTVSGFLKAQMGKIFQNPFKALADMNVLGIIIFALLLGGILTTLGERGEALLKTFDGLNEAMMKLVHLVMYLAPLGVFALMADQIAAAGMGILLVLAAYMGTILLGIAIHALVVLPLLLKTLTGRSPLVFARQMRRALAVAFSTCSSSATMPVTLDCLTEEAEVSPKVAGFVVPLGATVNMDGTALYEAVAALFIAQVYGVELGLTEQVLVALTATLAAIGAAGIPSAGTVTMVMVLAAVGLPLQGIGLILAVDRFLDMFRTVTNVWGDAIGTAVVERLDAAASTS